MPKVFLINKYQNKPFWKWIYKDIKYIIRYWRLYYKNKHKHKTVLFYPEYPLKRNLLHQIFKSLNYNITNNPNQTFQYVIKCKDTTIDTGNGYEILDKISRNYKIINKDCLDISKRKVDKVFSEVFQYSSFVDPLTYKGKYIQKNDLNAKHDGFILTEPIQSTKKGYVYQKLINNLHDDKTTIEMRVPVMKGHIPFVYYKYKPVNDRFGCKLENTEVINTHKALSTEEQGKIALFCQKMNLDFTELDILRDKDNQRIYITDANNNPTGPPSYMSRKKAINRLAQSLCKYVLQEI